MCSMTNYAIQIQFSNEIIQVKQYKQLCDQIHIETFS